MIDVLPKPDPTVPDTTGEYVHLYCDCDRRFSICGIYAEGEMVEDEYGPACKQCENLLQEGWVCCRCGWSSK